MSDAERVRAEAVVKQWRDAIAKKDWAAFAQLYAEDAVAMPPNAPLISGRSEIAQWFSSPGIAVTAFAAKPVAVEGEGALIVVRTMTFAVAGAGAPVTERGKGVLVLRRDESWRIGIDIWNADAPADGAA